MTDLIFKRAGNCFIPTEGSLPTVDKLPPGTYALRYHQVGMDKHLHIVGIDDLAVTGKIYGPVEKRAERMIKTFLAREGVTTGVMLNGEKGTGKTMLSKRTCELARTRHGLATIVIDQPFAGPDFIQLIASIKQPLVLLFDEFEKVYRGGGQHDGNGNEQLPGQEALLPLLDGAFSSHKLCIFVTNQPNVVETMLNRPGRVFYRWNYDRLEGATVVQYAQDHLKNKEHLESLCEMMQLVEVSSFDVLKGLIWEMNEYGQDALEAVNNMNISWEAHKSCSIRTSAVAGEFEGRTWTQTAHINLISKTFSSALAKKEVHREPKLMTAMHAAGANPHEIYTPGAEAHRYERGMAPEDFLNSFDERYIYLDVGPEHLISVNHEEEVMEFQHGDFLIQVSLIETLGNKSDNGRKRFDAYLKQGEDARAPKKLPNNTTRGHFVKVPDQGSVMSRLSTKHFLPSFPFPNGGGGESSF